MKPLAERLTAAQEQGARAVAATSQRYDVAVTAQAKAAKALATVEATLASTTSETTEGELEKLVRTRELAGHRARHANADEANARQARSTAQREANLWVEAVFEEEAFENGVRPILVLSEEIKAIEQRLMAIRWEQDRLLRTHVTPFFAAIVSVHNVEVMYGGAMPAKDKAFAETEAVAVTMQMVNEGNANR